MNYVKAFFKWSGLMSLIYGVAAVVVGFYIFLSGLFGGPAAALLFVVLLVGVFGILAEFMQS